MSDINPLPPPVPSEDVAIWDLVIADMQARDLFGRQKYGTPLQADNGRQALVDMYQEGLDLVVYAKAAILQQAQGTIIETIHSVEAMTHAIAKRTKSQVMRSAAERVSLEALLHELTRALLPVREGDAG